MDSLYSIKVECVKNVKGMYNWFLLDIEDRVIYKGESTSQQSAWDEAWVLLGP